MNSKIKSLLLPFYFGAISESERIVVERELLADSEVLVDFLDLKRSIEVAEPIPCGPSFGLWTRLSRHSKFQKKAIWTLSFGAGLVAASVLVFLFFKSPLFFEHGSSKAKGQEILFDSNSELSTSSNVL